ncbi:MAG: hypothetical protein ACOY40_14705 [Bacillota bacterium]
MEVVFIVNSALANRWPYKPIAEILRSDRAWIKPGSENKKRPRMGPGHSDIEGLQKTLAGSMGKGRFSGFCLGG